MHAAYRVPAIAASAVLAIVVMLMFVFPSATVTLTPVSQSLSASLEMTGVNGLAKVDYERNQVPARTIVVEQEASDTIPTTSKQDVPDGHAQGAVVFANKTSSAVQIPKGTVVSTSFGRNVRFFTVSDVSLSGEVHRTVRVGVLAAEPGPGGNVPPLTINTVEGELAAQIDVLNDGRTEGGSVRRVSAVDAQDKVALRAKLMEKVQREAYQELTNALSLEEFVPPASLSVSVLGEEFDHKVGEVADALQMTMRVQVEGLAVSGTGGQQLLTRELQKKLPKGYRLVTQKAQYTRGEIVGATGDQARFSMSAQAMMAVVIDQWTVRRTVAGKRLAEAQQALMNKYSLQRQPHIETASSLLGRLPWFTLRIRVVDALE